MRTFIKKIIDWFLYNLLGKKKKISEKHFTVKETIHNTRLSKKVKLSKEYWIKGKSKFLDYRLREENKNNINELKIIKNYV